MLTAIFLAAALAGTAPADTHSEVLANAITHFRGLESYRVTILSLHDGGDIHIRYYYRRPGFVRMEFIRPHAGAVVIFDPGSKRVRLWPFGAGKFPELDLSPESLLIRSMSGIRVDRSDVGSLFENIRALGESGSTRILGKESREGRSVLHFIVTGDAGRTVDGVHSSEMWLDEANQFPVKVVSRNLHGDIIETVLMEDLGIDEKLPEALFNP